MVISHKNNIDTNPKEQFPVGNCWEDHIDNKQVHKLKIRRENYHMKAMKNREEQQKCEKEKEN